MTDILIFLLILFAVILPLGRMMVSLFTREQTLCVRDKVFLYFGIGSGLLGLVVLYIGLFGYLYKNVIIFSLLVMAIMLSEGSTAFIKELYNSAKENIFKTNLEPIEIFIISALVFVWALSLFGSLSPLIGMDAASYHMRDPKIFIENHRMALVPYTRDSMWPFLIQMLFTLGLILKGAILSKLFNFAYGIGAIAGLYSLCRLYWSRKYSLMAAGIFGTIPAIFASAEYAYTDLAVIFYTILSFYGFFRLVLTKRVSWFYISAAGCGFLLGIKITSAIVPFIIAAFFLLNSIRTRAKIFKGIIYPLSLFGGMIFILAGVWYIRSWIVLGNPIFPFASYLFGGYGYPEKYLRYQTTSGIGTGVVQYIVMLWPLTIHPDKFGGESIGPLFLLFIPMVLFLKKISSFMKYIFAVIFMMYTSWFIVYQYIRFLYPTIVFMSIAVAYLYFEVFKNDKLLSRITLIIMCGSFFYSAGLALYHNMDNIAVTIGKESPRDYLLRRERMYAISEYINSNTPPDAKILVLSEPRLYYINRDAALATSMQKDLLYNKNFNHKGSLDDYLYKKGYSYLLFTVDKSNPGYAPMSILPNNVFQNSIKTLVKEVEYNYRGEHFVYQLFKITPKGRKS